MDFGNTNIVFLFYRTTLVFIVLLILTRALGKKQMSELTFFNYITGITIGSIAANMVTESNKSLIDGFIGLIWWCVLTELAAYIGLKSGHLRRIIDGQPTIVIKKGKILKHSLKSMRFNMDDLTMLLRKNSIFSIAEVEYAILEPDGNLSVMKKEPKQQVTKEDMKIPTATVNHIPLEIISDGKIIHHNLVELNLNEKWLETQLKKQNIDSVSEIFYAEIQNDGSLLIQKN